MAFANRLLILSILLVMLLPLPSRAGESSPPEPCEELKELALIKAIREKKGIVDKEAQALSTDISTLGDRCKPYMGQDTVQTGIEMAQLNRSRLDVTKSHQYFLHALLDFTRSVDKATLAFDYLNEKDCRKELSLLSELYQSKMKTFGARVNSACTVK